MTLIERIDNLLATPGLPSGSRQVLQDIRRRAADSRLADRWYVSLIKSSLSPDDKSDHRPSEGDYDDRTRQPAHR